MSSGKHITSPYAFTFKISCVTDAIVFTKCTIMIDKGLRSGKRRV